MTFGAGIATHEVTNQPPVRDGGDALAEDAVLATAATRLAGSDRADDLHATGRLVASAAWREVGERANANPPRLVTHDRFGHRVDRVEYHPAYHQLMTAGLEHGLGAGVWVDDRPGAHAARAVAFVLWPRVDAGTLCPSTMTHAAVPTLRREPDLAARWEPLVVADDYDPSFRPTRAHQPDGKASALIGMAMTEKQGGSDVRANTTTAVPDGQAHRLTGHKWFCSAPMNDAFLVLARLEAGREAGPGAGRSGSAAPSCFLVPRWLPDGTQNPFHLQRLKDKLGDRSNASAEVEFADTRGWLVGEPHRGVPTIMAMVAATRRDCVLGSAGQMRHGVVEAAWHVAHRSAFGRRLAHQPLMRNVVADLSLEAAAATLLGLRLAQAADHPDDDHEQSLARLVTPVAKYWVCKRAPGHAAEALECLGGNGYVEESGLPRLFRQSPLNGIWEGSGNVQALDVLRVLHRTPAAVEAVRDELRAVRGANTHLDQAIDELDDHLLDPDEASARRMVEHLAVTLQASLLVRHEHTALADAFCASRLDDRHGAWGTLPGDADLDAILARTHPILA